MAIETGRSNSRDVRARYKIFALLVSPTSPAFSTSLPKWPRMLRQLTRSPAMASNSSTLGGGGGGGFVSSALFFLAARCLASAFLQASLKVSVMAPPRSIQRGSAVRAKRLPVGDEGKANQCRQLALAPTTTDANSRSNGR